MKCVPFLRVKQVNLGSLEEMECLAKKEHTDYQGSRCVVQYGQVFVSCCLLRICSVHCAVLLSVIIL